jgi:hypothetical protein
MVSMVTSHNFSRSPVEEVMFRFCSENGQCVEEVFPSPYPGWEKIKNQIIQSFEQTANNKITTDCILKYTDVFLLTTGDIPGNLILIAPMVPVDIRSLIVQGPVSEINIAGSIENLVINVRYEQNNDKMILVFKASNKDQFTFSRDEMLVWFDTARENIHRIFDAIVTSKLINRIS